MTDRILGLEITTPHNFEGTAQFLLPSPMPCFLQLVWLHQSPEVGFCLKILFRFTELFNFISNIFSFLKSKIRLKKLTMMFSNFLYLRNTFPQNLVPGKCLNLTETSMLSFMRQQALSNHCDSFFILTISVQLH